MQAAGQCLIIGFDAKEMNSRLRTLLTRVQPAGVILFARNIERPEQAWTLLRECRRCVSTPLFTCVDLEGGTVDRFRDVLGPAPAAAEVFATRDRKLFRKHGEIIGRNCRALGFNIDFAPVLDLALPVSHKVMGSRVVSSDPRQTVAYAREFLAGLKRSSVLGCGKHFPGLGEGKLDSHHELPVIRKSLKKMWSEDLAPYRALRNQLHLVMISHAAYPMVTRKPTPASLSSEWVTGVLRKRIGYRNLIVSDDLEMGGVLSAAPVDRAAVEFVRAGGDLCLVCHREEYVMQAYESLIQESERDKKFARRLAEAARRVLAFKKKQSKMLRMNPVPRKSAIERLTRSLWEFAECVRLESLDRR